MARASHSKPQRTQFPTIPSPASPPPPPSPRPLAFQHPPFPIRTCFPVPCSAANPPTGTIARLIYFGFYFWLLGHHSRPLPLASVYRALPIGPPRHSVSPSHVAASPTSRPLVKVFDGHPGLLLPLLSRSSVPTPAWLPLAESPGLLSMQTATVAYRSAPVALPAFPLTLRLPRYWWHASDC